MELLEDEYEDELIDAFDAPEPQVLTPSKRPAPAPLPTRHNPGQPRRPNVQEFQNKTALYPTFDDKTPAPAVPEMVPSRTAQQYDTSKTMEAEHVLQYEPPPPAQMYQDDEFMSTEELQRRRQKIEREMKVYQERFDRVAQALAGRHHTRLKSVGSERRNDWNARRSGTRPWRRVCSTRLSDWRREKSDELGFKLDTIGQVEVRPQAVVWTKAGKQRMLGTARRKQSKGQLL